MAAPLARAVAAAALQQSVVLHIALSAKLAMHAMSSFVYLVFFIPSRCLLAACALGAILGPEWPCALLRRWAYLIIQNVFCCVFELGFSRRAISKGHP